MTELLSCPFCGGDVSFHKDEECPGCHLIQCGQCRAFFDFATGADPGNDCASVDALRAAIAPMWNTRVQLAAIQGGMGEEVEVVAWRHFGDASRLLCDLGKQRSVPGDYAAEFNMPLMTVAQHQRILAALSAQQSAPERTDGWISVSERLPDVAQEVIVDSEFDGVTAGFLDSYGEWYSPNSDYKLTRVVAWQPLPAAPALAASIRQEVE